MPHIALQSPSLSSSRLPRFFQPGSVCVTHLTLHMGISCDKNPGLGCDTLYEGFGCTSTLAVKASRRVTLKEKVRLGKKTLMADA